MDDRERILVVRLSSLGDVLLTAPAMRAIRRRFSDAEIHFLVAAEYADAARLIPGHDAVIEFDRARGFPELWKLRGELFRSYSLLVDLQNSWRSAFLRTFSFPTLWVAAKRYRLRRWLLIQFKWNLLGSTRSVASRYLEAVEPLGAEDDGAGLDLRVPWDATRWATQYLIENKIEEPYLVLCPGARHFTKRWPAERWSALAHGLHKDKFAIVVAGTRSEMGVIETIRSSVPACAVLVENDLTRVAAVIERARAVVTHDSGLMHLAAGLNRPVVAIYGPTVEQFGFFPYRARATVLQNDLNCRPCSAYGGSRCPKGHFRCMLETEVSQVLSAVRNIAIG